MLYSYTITSNFLKELANLEYNKTEKICGFIKSQFIKKPNLYLSINRKILEKKYGDKSNDQIDKLIKTLSNHNKEIFEKKNISKDFIFVGKEDKYGKIKINCDAILNNPEKVENFIESKMDDYWSGGSEPQKFIKLQEHFNRIFLFNENIVFVYRFLIIPYIEINHPKFLKNYTTKIQINSYNRFLEFLSKVRNEKKFNFKIYMSIANRHKKYSEDIQLDVEEKLKELFNNFLEKNDEIIVKDNGHKDKHFREIFHDRYIISCVEGFENEENTLPEDINVFDCGAGMQFFTDKDTTKKGIKLQRLTNKTSNEIWKEFSKNMAKIDNYIKIVA